MSKKIITIEHLENDDINIRFENLKKSETLSLLINVLHYFVYNSTEDEPSRVRDVILDGIVTHFSSKKVRTK